ncbi:acetyl/propionyl/methylcrotonyl-CoA carboxylase subunit alpha [Saccharospirillum impatiens]|uniref:acetyl/propionyl/methylcrotonyl-CoA carboxylase subunit alpha n=1 Tax=Saccharospirillum impatiens TaxID=169438 RepID=UPI0004142892|nr:biotin carboxylase N-terminal domain-containing protein [Saccharospirillum impatiens]
MKRIHRLLIANRGEIARRIQRSARALGIETVAVYSEADHNALHVREADQAICLGGATASQSYLNRDALLAAMRDTGADALHPGYGFLSEDANFAEAVIDAGFIWVGPPPEAMRSMASKAAAKQTLEPRGVPMIPGYHGDDQSDERLLAEAETIGFPLLVKASAGGGGKGMRVVERLDQVADALASARREARNAFGDDRLLLERYLVNPRHVEVQVMADQHGAVWSLFERDCSLQRRHQKVVEEAPAPALDDDTRTAMWKAAEIAAASIGYVGAGTVEYIVDASGDFFFLEMNTRLQVEHPVTECITGLDLVALQLRVAEGESLPAERPAEPVGHAFEVRLYAEDPEQDFRPTTGMLSQVVWPQGPGVRVDTGVESGSEISPFYDPMLAKLIVHGADRREALARLNRALADTRLAGLTTNLNFLRRLCAAPDLAEFTIHTHWIETHRDQWETRAEQPACWSALAASAIQHTLDSGHADPWQKLSGWRRFQQRRWLYNRSETEQCVVTEHQGVWQAHCGTETLTLSDVTVESLGAGHYRVHGRAGQRRRQLDAWPQAGGIEVDDGHSRWLQLWWQAEAAHEDGAGGDGLVKALMPGTVTAIHQTTGTRVKRGDKILSMEAMKMETTLTAPTDGTLVQCSLSVGDRVDDGQVVFVVEADEEDAA